MKRSLHATGTEEKRTTAGRLQSDCMSMNITHDTIQNRSHPETISAPLKVIPHVKCSIFSFRSVVIFSCVHHSTDSPVIFRN